MFLTIIVGETGTGKSSIAKLLLKRASHIAVLDHQHEYGLPGLFESDRNKFAMFPGSFSVNDFVQMTKHVNGYTIVAEECTGLIDSDFFKSKLGKELIQVILSKRHPGKNNNWIFIFHTLNNIPPVLMGFCDYLYLYKTGDLDRTIQGKYPDMYNDWKGICASQDRKLVPGSDNHYISDFKLLLRTNLAKQNPNYPVNF